MRMIDSNTLLRLQELPIAEVVERYTHLTPGPNNTICCPFHAEKTPSCHLYSDHLHCFGCGAHTDNIGFVMLHKNVPFKEGQGIRRYSYTDNGLYLVNNHSGFEDKLSRVDVKTTQP